MSNNTFESSYWRPELVELDLPGGQETVLDGRARDFGRIVEPFENIEDVTVVGYSSQGPAHALNLRESLREAGLATTVSVALREGSPNRDRAERDGFTVEDGTLVVPEVGLARGGLVLMLISDAGMAQNGVELLGNMPSGSTVGFAHGFYPGFLATRGQVIRPDLDVIGVCPKGMGPSVRRLYEQGYGINSSAAWPEGNPSARDLALAWSYAIGSPFTFQTSLESERNSDLVGERAILLGQVQAIVEAVYLTRRLQGAEPEATYLDTVESLVQGIASTISEHGLKGVYEALDGGQREEFVRAYNAAYPSFFKVTEKVYRDVKSGREVDEVFEDGKSGMPMSSVAGSEMWEVGSKMRADPDRLRHFDAIDPVVAGLYVAGMMAQIDVLRANGHHWSEVVNESVIEAVDSLLPFMRARGVDFMIDNCSETARRGARKWAPVYQAWLINDILPRIQSGAAQSHGESKPFESFMAHPAHGAFSILSRLRPEVSIAVD